ncbi:MAG: molybdopterin-synthase adenylyltransferase MoeB, partial [Leptospiraceae bacterium]|nr:molybdopterin-synthase adenylyltransferase MoeB [Leptospiraceae bacterium]
MRVVSILSPEELRRYNRHIILPQIGLEGQRRLKDSSALIIGVGGLGSPLALYLAAAGIGRLGLVDYDRVEESNLQRQVLHTTSTLGKSKLESARGHLLDLNPHLQIDLHDLKLSSANARSIFKDYQVIADGSDNFPTRYLVNDAAVLTNRPVVYGSIFQFEGQLSVFHFNGGPCYRCLYPEPPAPGAVASCAEGGVLGVLPGVIGALQANEVIKILAGIGSVAVGRLLVYDALELKFRELHFERNVDCAICGDRPSITELIDYHLFCGVAEQHNESDAIIAGNPYEITVQELNERLESSGDHQRSSNNFIILDVREPHEYEISRLTNSLLIPLSELDARLDELDREREYIV